MRRPQPSLPPWPWMKIALCAIALAGASAPMVAAATVVYRCSEGGSVVLSQFPCAGGQRQPVREDLRTEAQLHDALNRRARAQEQLQRAQAAQRKQAEQPALVSKTPAAAPEPDNDTPPKRARRAQGRDPRLFTARAPRATQAAPAGNAQDASR